MRYPLTMASAPVAQALLTLQTWPPIPNNPAMRALTELDMMRSGIELPKRRTRPASVMGISVLPTVSTLPIPEPKEMAVSQSTFPWWSHIKPASSQQSRPAMHPMIAWRSIPARFELSK